VMRQVVANISADTTCLHVINMPLVRMYQTSRRRVRNDCGLNTDAGIPDLAFLCVSGCKQWPLECVRWLKKEVERVVACCMALSHLVNYGH
jgi:hypothetical protein